MPTDLERELLRMAAEERARNQRPEPEGELPDLDPSLLLSRSARQEMGVIRVSTPVSQSVPFEAAVELSGPDANWVREELERGHISAVSMGARVAAEQPNANGDVFPAALLASMFMTREARAQAELAGVADLLAEGAGIEFDSEDYPETIRMGRQYGMTHNAARHYSSGGGGRVVSQRGADGRFHAVGSGIQPMPPERAATAPISPRRTYPDTRPAGTVKLPPSPPRRPVDRSRIPTAIERIAGKDPFDD